MDRFEYKIIVLEIRASYRVPKELESTQHALELSEAGAEGWEVITCVTIDKSRYTQALLYTLKRKLP